MIERAIAAAFREACQAELLALKPGNVHIYADGHRMTAADFETSAGAAAPHIAAAGSTAGERILGAVRATRERVGQNTNLGIILLCAPLAAAAERMARRQSSLTGIQAHLAAILTGLTVEDATLAFQAIALASPGGLGNAAQHDVRQPARVTLLDAMCAASSRDRIAYQYANQFADIFGACVLAAGKPAPQAAEHIYWHFLTNIPDSHIARKFGTGTAEEIRTLARDADRRVASLTGGEERHTILLELDATLKARGINPGTSADHTVATLFAGALQIILG